MTNREKEKMIRIAEKRAELKEKKNNYKLEKYYGRDGKTNNND